MMLSTLSSMSRVGARQMSKRFMSSMKLAPKKGFVKPEGPVCLLILDGVGLGDKDVRAIGLHLRL